MTTDTIRQHRGLILAWRTRPEWLRQLPGNKPTSVEQAGTTTKKSTHIRYRRVELKTVHVLSGKGSIKSQSGRCRWCQRTVQEKGRRLWHQKCVNAYWAATGNQSALTEATRKEHHLNNEDNHPPCDECGLTSQQAEQKAEAFRQKAKATSQRYDAKELDYNTMASQYSELMEQARIALQFELDHQDALSVAWASGSERRLIRALTLANLRWLCHPCHAKKTGQDRRRMRNLLDGRAEDWTPPPSTKRARIQSLQMTLPEPTSPDAKGKSNQPKHRSPTRGTPAQPTNSSAAESASLPSTAQYCAQPTATSNIEA